MERGLLLVASSAFLGGIISALLGWLDSSEPFAPRKFLKSVVAALLAGVGFAVAYNFGDHPGLRDYFIAFLGGAGVDVVTNRIAGAIRPPPPTPPGP